MYLYIKLCPKNKRELISANYDIFCPKKAVDEMSQQLYMYMMISKWPKSIKSILSKSYLHNSYHEYWSKFKYVIKRKFSSTFIERPPKLDQILITV